VNIFYLDKCPYKAAEVQYNKHVVKMILESAQMLCTAHHVLGSSVNIPYKAAHINHPSTIWVRENSSHYDWLCMPDEYKDKCSIQAYWNYYIGEKHSVANKKTEKIYDRRPN
jgi:hypothetical protein